MKIAIGSDHGGYDLKMFVAEVLNRHGHTVVDMGCDSVESVDYPDYAAAVARRVAEPRVDRGVAICTTGIGVGITANRFPGVRAALCLNVEMAEMTRRHNDSNVLCLSQKFTPEPVAEQILNTWLSTDFEGGRHQRRLDKIESYAGLSVRVSPSTSNGVSMIVPTSLVSPRI